MATAIQLASPLKQPYIMVILFPACFQQARGFFYAFVILDAGYRIHSLSCMVYPAGVVGSVRLGITIASKTIVEKTGTMSSLLHIWAHAEVYIQYVIDMFCTRSGNISPSCALATHVSQTGCPVCLNELGWAPICGCVVLTHEDIHMVCLAASPTSCYRPLSRC